MTVKLLTEHHLKYRGCTGSSESIHVKMPHGWKLHVATHFINYTPPQFYPLHWQNSIRVGNSVDPGQFLFFSSIFSSTSKHKYLKYFGKKMAFSKLKIVRFSIPS